jgi:hypothetical protein
MVVTNVTPRTGHSPENQSLVLSLWLRGNAAYSFRRALFDTGLMVLAGSIRRKFAKMQDSVLSGFAFLNASLSRRTA